MKNVFKWVQWISGMVILALAVVGCAGTADQSVSRTGATNVLAAPALEPFQSVTGRQHTLVEAAILVANQNSPVPARTNFVPGYDTTTIDGIAEFPYLNHYILRAASGHAMAVELTSASSDVYFSIHGVDDGQPYKRLDEAGNSWSAALPDTQDYLLTVANQGGKAPFSVVVVLEPRLTFGNLLPARLHTSQGDNLTEVSGTVTAEAQKRFLLHGEAGGHLTVEIHSEIRSAQFGLVGVDDNRTYKWIYDGALMWSGILPTTQDYLLIVDSMRDTAEYDLTVTMY